MVGGAQRRLEMRARLLERGERGVERLHRRIDQRRRLRGTALEPPQRRRQRRHRRLRARHRLVGVAQVARDLLDRHHGGAALGQRGLLVALRRQPRELLDRVAQPVGLALRALDLGAVGRKLALARAAHLPQPLHRAGVGFERAEGVEQPAMGGDVDQRALVVLAVDLDQRGAERLQGLRAHRLVVDESAGAAVGELHAAQDQLVLGRDVVCRHQRARRMRGRQLEGGGHLALLGAVAHQRDVAARAQRQREGIEQDRLAGAGLAGQHRQAAREIDIEPIDQDDVADREPGEHASCPICTLHQDAGIATRARVAHFL